jgi:DNA ligase-1
MLSDLVDTVDLVVMGYYMGSGKRSGFGVGAILGGVYNGEEDRFESCTKIGTGITDELLGEIKGRLDGLVVGDMPLNYFVDERLKPDVWVSPEIVVEVDADELTKGKGTDDSFPAKGLSLRFPRLVEFDRDKLASEATSVRELSSMYRS